MRFIHLKGLYILLKNLPYAKKILWCIHIFSLVSPWPASPSYEVPFAKARLELRYIRQWLYFGNSLKNLRVTPSTMRLQGKYPSNICDVKSC